MFGGFLLRVIDYAVLVGFFWLCIIMLLVCFVLFDLGWFVRWLVCCIWLWCLDLLGLSYCYVLCSLFRFCFAVAGGLVGLIAGLTFVD